MEKSEKPVTSVVTHSSTVLRNTFSFFREANRPQKHSTSTPTRKKRAPVLYGRPNPFTKMRSNQAASLGKYGMKRYTSRNSMTTPIPKTMESCLKDSFLSRFLR